MRTLLVTPLYPPDIAGPAPYIKELAKRLSGHHDITVLAYNHIPETIPNVRIITIEKASVLPVRLWRFFVTLLREGRKHEIVYVQNGPSVELPTIIASFLFSTPIYFRLGDEVALNHVRTKPFLRSLLKLTVLRSQKVIVHSETSPSFDEFQSMIPHSKTCDIKRPHAKPEILPFVPFPQADIDAFEASWQTHLNDLFSIFTLHD